MGDIVPFLARVRSSGDWTAAERARLEELADRFAALAEGVEVVFGATDEGDPWCVVKDAQDEVLVHVARIGGRFIVHYALDDALAEGADLPGLLGERLNWDEDERDDVVVPFSRQAQSLLALIVATAFYYETRHLDVGKPTYGEPATDGPLPSDTILPDDAASAEHAMPAAAHAAKAGLVLGALSWPSRSFAAQDDPAPLPGHAGGWSTGGEVAAAGGAAEAPALAQPSAWGAADRPAAFVLADASPLHRASGGGGADPGGPSPPGGGGDGPSGPADPPGVEGLTGGRQWLLEGSDDADRLDLSNNAVAVGGGGGDAFVLHDPGQVADAASNRLGVIADFNAAEGDRLMSSTGRMVDILSTTATTTTLTAVPSTLHTLKTASLTGVSTTTTEPVTVAGRMVQVDLDGDGRADGYVVLLNSASTQTAAEGYDDRWVSGDLDLLLPGRGFDYDI